MYSRVLGLIPIIPQITLALPSPQGMMGAIIKFGEDFTYPRVNVIANQIKYSGFSSNVVGRVDVTNTYTGNELNTEYFFGLFSSLGLQNTTRLIGIPIGNGTMTELALNPPITSFSAIRIFDWGPISIPIQLDVWFRFDDQLQISQYDITFRRLAWAFDSVTPHLRPILAAESDLKDIDSQDVNALMHKRAAIDICAEHEQYCVGNLKQYSSKQSCVDFVYREMPLGEAYQLGQDTAMCRYIHKGMLRFRPEVHCIHIGPTGGGMCINRNYAQEVTANIYPEQFIGAGISA